ncbi:UDP-N-acetylglucosamine transferase subunit ALG13 [Pilibacter termitis]|uniref:UDP-N-acetylglucosamine transferase subunit ALG13 n=1 Tax=Pilibacter termitis TaxID=263852 RepID=A0A1T4QZW6_9ENTE|nr:glycosyltransferase [Pilibacter termitis]SKA09273.1 UDP-N-acetylglucosamine transferase subunit ALG13 [Pilibacter termitis]
MILIVLGTQDSPFPRILKECEIAAEKLGLTEEIIAQIGTTKYESTRISLKAYYERTEFLRLIEQARVVITHGGAGTIYQCLHSGKKIIVMPRNAEFGEHNDNHQFELTEVLARDGYVLRADTSLVASLSEIDNFTPKPYVTQNDILEVVEQFIEGI